MARYPGATWYGDNIPNKGGPIGQVRLGVMHIMSGTLAGTDSWFQNPNAQVSAHFGIGKNGEVHQYVDTSLTAWAEADYNSVSISIEHEGQSGDSLTPQQIAADADLYNWLNQTSNIPLVRTSDPNGSGWIGHGELGAAGGGHPACPGQPILNQIPTIISQAKPQPVPTPTPSKGNIMAVTPVLTYDAGRQDVFQCANNSLWHKSRNSSGKWTNECIAGPSNPVSKVSITVPNQIPGVTVTGGQVLVTIEDDRGLVFYFAQNVGGTGWGAIQLP